MTLPPAPPSVRTLCWCIKDGHNLVTQSRRDLAFSNATIYILGSQVPPAAPPRYSDAMAKVHIAYAEP